MINFKNRRCFKMWRPWGGQQQSYPKRGKLWRGEKCSVFQRPISKAVTELKKFALISKCLVNHITKALKNPSRTNKQNHNGAIFISKTIIGQSTNKCSQKQQTRKFPGYISVDFKKRKIGISHIIIFPPMYIKRS